MVIRNIIGKFFCYCQELEFVSTTVVTVKIRPVGSTRGGGESSVKRGVVLVTLKYVQVMVSVSEPA